MQHWHVRVRLEAACLLKTLRGERRSFRGDFNERITIRVYLSNWVRLGRRDFDDESYCSGRENHAFGIR